MTLVRAHGFSFRMPMRATLTPALRALVFGPSRVTSVAPRHFSRAFLRRLRDTGVLPAAFSSGALERQRRAIHATSRMAPRTSFLAPHVLASASPIVGLGGETITVPFTTGTTGVRTSQSYSGSVTITVSGVGNAAGTNLSDAFYLYQDESGNPITPPQHSSDYYNFTLHIDGGPADAYVQPIPAYRADHVYTFRITAPGGPLTFGVGDGITYDNGGAYTVTIAAPSSMPGDQGRNTDHCPCAQPSTSNPVNTRTGNYWTDATDLLVSPPGPSLGWVRTYNSQGTGDADQPGLLGYGWQVPYMTHIITAGAPGGEPGVAIIVSSSGNRFRFEDLGNGAFQSFPGIDATLAQAGGAYTETLRTGEKLAYDATGRVTAMTDAQGRRVLLQYSGSQLTRVVDAANPQRFLALDYDPAGAHVIAVHDPAGRTMRYSYDNNGDLVGTTDVMGRAVVYHYQNHLLTEIDNTLGQPEERIAYDAYMPSGRVISQTLQDGEQIAMDYAPDHTTITTTGTGGTQDVEQVLYDAQRNVMTGIVKNGTLVQQTEFDGDFAPDLIVDADGNQTQIVSNGAGFPRSVTNATGATSQISYDTQNRPITETDPLGRQSVISYDSNGNVVRVTTGITTDNPLGATTVYTYNVRYPGNNWLEEQRTPDGVVTHYDYNITGQVVTETVGYGTAQAQATAYGYDTAGRVMTTTVGAGSPLQRVDVTHYNADNTVAQIIMNYMGAGAFDPAHPDQNVTVGYGYDALGRQTWVRDALGHYDAARYNASGQTDWTARNLSPVAIDASGQPVMPVTPPAFTPAQPDQNVATFYGYDGLGRETLVTQTGILTGTFSAATRTFSDATTRTTRTGYDAQDNPVTTTLNYRPDLPVGAFPDVNAQTVTQYDPQGNVRGQRDALGRAIESVDALGHVTHTTYDGLDQAATVTANDVPGGPVNADTNVTTSYGYDALGHTTVVTDGVGATTSYGYNGLGEAIAITDSADRVTNSGFDGTGALRWTATPDGRLTVLQVDGLGRVVTAIQNYHTGVAIATTPPDQDLTTRTVYDVGGRRVQSIDPAGHVTAYGYDLLDHVIWVQTNVQAGTCVALPCNVTTTYGYDRAGQRVSITDPRGYTQYAAYDAAGERTSATDALTRTTTWDYDLGGRMLVQHDPRGPADDISYAYDGLDRVITTTAQNLTAPIRTQYDALGQRTALTDGTGTTRFTYDALGRTTGVSAPGTGQVAYGYNADGQRTSVQYPDNTAVGYAYDSGGQLHSVTQGSTTLVSYAYDGAGRVSQVARSNGATTTYAYDGADRLLDMSTTVNGAPVSRFTNQVDRLGNQTEITETLPLTTAPPPSSSGRVGVLDMSGSDCHLVVQGGTVSASALTVNGSSRNALCLNGGVISTTAVTVQGGVRKQGGVITGTVSTNQPAATDPLSATVAPSKPGVSCPGAACPDGTNFNAGGTYRLLPGYYNQTLNFNNGATICLAPGTYYLDASWNVGTVLRPYGSSGCPAVPTGTTDTGVLLYFHAGILQLNSGGDVTRLSALTSGPDAGVLYWQASAASNAPNGAFGGGAWYEPVGSLTLNSGTTFTATLLIVADLMVNGGATLTAGGPGSSVSSGGPTIPISATRVITYAYDGLQRLTDAVENPGAAYHYGYDLAGNRTDVSVNGGPITHTAYDAANQVVGWSYDAAGNVISDTARSYTYDALDRLTGLSAGAGQEAYAYNGDGTLVSQTVGLSTTQFTQDLAGSESQILATQTGGGANTDYLYGLDRLASVSGGTRTWYGTDPQGSVRYTLDDAGNAGAPRSYDPFGTPESAASSGLFGYTGEVQDVTTGLENLRARWYNPGWGQFLGRDPLEGATGQAYAYAGDNPVNGSDPSGLCTFREGGQTVTFAGLGGPGPCDEQFLARLRAEYGPASSAAAANTAGSGRAIDATLGSLACDAKDPLTRARIGLGQTVAGTVVPVLNPGQSVTGASEERAVEGAVRFLAERAASAAPAIGETAGGAVVAEDAAVGLGATVTLVGAVIALPELLIAVAVVAVVVGGVLFFVAVANPPRAAPQPQTQTQPAPQPAPTPGPQPEPIPVPPVAPPTTTPQDENKPAYRLGNRNARNLTPADKDIAGPPPHGLSLTTTNFPEKKIVFPGGKNQLRLLGFDVIDAPSLRDPGHFLLGLGPGQQAAGLTIEAWAGSKATTVNTERSTWYPLTSLLASVAEPPIVP